MVTDELSNLLVTISAGMLPAVEIMVVVNTVIDLEFVAEAAAALETGIGVDVVVDINVNSLTAFLTVLKLALLSASRESLLFC